MGIRSWLRWGVLALNATATTGCSGDFTTETSPASESVGGATDTSTESSGGTGPAMMPPGTGGMPVQPLQDCPPEAPDQLHPCEPGLSCTYGEEPRLSCRDTYECDESGGWQVTVPQCEPLDDCFDELPYQYGGAVCNEIGRTCWYPESYPACVCTPCAEGDCSDVGTYQCEVTDSTCPPVAPNVGQPCGEPAADPPGATRTCTYVPCGSPYQLAMGCVAGEWAELEMDCPQPE